MKKLFIAFSLAFYLFVTIAFASDIDVTPQVLKSFESSFVTAKNVKWSLVESLYLAEFNVDGQQISAFYDVEGKLVASARHIPVVQMPISLQSSLKSHTEGYQVIDVFELNNDDGTNYYVTIENDSKRILLKSGVNSDWSTYKKTKK
jgi:hypothetical protein